MPAKKKTAEEPIEESVPVHAARQGSKEVAVGWDDGEVTVTRPGVESRTYTVEGGKVSLTAGELDWLAEHSPTAISVAAENDQE